MFGQNYTPAVTSENDTAAYELGVKFQTSVSGWVAGVRFYKGSGNTGTHTGSLWTSSGTRLATGTFTNETASGWQTLKFTNADPDQREHAVRGLVLRPERALRRRSGTVLLPLNRAAVHGAENRCLHRRLQW